MQIMSCVMQSLMKWLCVLYHAVNPFFALPTPDVLNSTEFAPSEPKSKAEVVSMKLVRFFNPVTCRPKSNQAVQPCKAGENINKTLCLQHECCTPSKPNIKFACYTPFEDRPQQILRFFGVGIGGVMLVAGFPFCFYIVEKSPCANPLRRKHRETWSEEGSEESGNDSKESNDSLSASLIQDDVEKQQTKKERGD